LALASCRRNVWIPHFSLAAPQTNKYGNDLTKKKINNSNDNDNSDDDDNNDNHNINHNNNFINKNYSNNTTIIIEMTLCVMYIQLL
jgi:hypothetical protein